LKASPAENFAAGLAVFATTGRAAEQGAREHRQFIELKYELLRIPRARAGRWAWPIWRDWKARLDSPFAPSYMLRGRAHEAAGRET